MPLRKQESADGLYSAGEWDGEEKRREERIIFYQHTSLGNTHADSRHQYAKEVHIEVFLRGGSIQRSEVNSSYALVGLHDFEFNLLESSRGDLAILDHIF